jgi:ABC-2 type transport system ATP-binding protein
MRRALVTIGVAAAVLAGAAPAAQGRDGYITSFDGTKIVYSFFPANGLKPGARATTVMVGPGYSSGRASSSDAMVHGFLASGYNVLTWDPRGFGDSGGNVEIDSPQYEARDASALIDFVAAQPEVQLDRPGDPHLGMAGLSYGGGIQWITAAADRRVDVIAPQISWHSLVSSLDKNNTTKGGWGSILFGLGAEGTTVPGVTGGVSGQPAGFQFGRSQDPAANQALLNGAATGELTPADQAFFAARGPDFLLSRIRVPTMIAEGTSDTLFTLKEAIQNYAAVGGNGVPIRMLWFCGSLTSSSIDHGICQTNAGADPSITLNATLRWMDRYLRGQREVDVGPRFEWISQDGVDHGLDTYPPPAGAPLVASGSGTLPLAAGDTSGELIAAGPAANAVSVPLPQVPRPTQLVGEPRLTLDYSGLAPSSNARVYAQLVDQATNQVVGPVVTPIALTLDGRPHTLSLPLEAVALDATPQSSYRLQITDGTTVYFAARQPGAITFSRISLSVPTVSPAVAAGDVLPGPLLRGGRPRLRLAVRPGSVTAGCRRFTFTVTSRVAGRNRRVSGARVALKARRVRTGRRGTAKLRMCFPRAGRYRPRAHKSGYRDGTARVRVRPRRRHHR